MSRMNPVKFKEVYAEMLQGIKSLAGKKAFLVVGKTGAGKSTTINYLLNLLIQQTDDSSPLQKKYKTTGGAVIGNHMESQTLLPSAYDFPVDGLVGLSASPFSLIDTAGLGDTRGPEVSLTVSLAVKLISELARIQGVVMVLPQQHFFTDRGIHLVEAFELISQMTTEFNPQTFMFCVTGLSNIPEADVAKTKEQLCRRLEEAAAIVDERIRGAVDDAERRRLENVSVALRRCMTMDNLFLMTDLENREQQEKVRKEFYERAQSMPGLQKPLELALPRELSLELQSWGMSVAQQANIFLADRTAIYAKRNDVAGKMHDLSRLHHLLSEAVDKSRKANLLLERAAEGKRTTEAELFALQERGSEKTKRRIEHTFRVPNLGSGITGGQLSKRIVVEAGDRFDHLELSMGAKSVMENAVKGAFEVLLEHQLNGSESNPFTLGFDVVHSLRDLPAYQDDLARLKESAAALESDVLEARRTQATSAELIEKLQAEIRKKAAVLGLPIGAEDELPTLLAQARRRLDAMAVELCQIDELKAAIDEAFAEQRDAMEFLDEVSGLAGLDRLRPEVAQFRRLFREAKVVVSIDAERVARSEVLRSPAHSSLSMFSVGGRPSVADSLLQQQREAQAAGTVRELTL